jgi:hypothetical protein
MHALMNVSGGQATRSQGNNLIQHTAVGDMLVAGPVAIDIFIQDLTDGIAVEAGFVADRIKQGAIDVK